MINKDIFIFYRTKNLYKVLKEDALMKHPESGDWIKCVIYEQYAEYKPETDEYVIIPDGEKKTFVREEVDFNNKFEAYGN